ncbi:EutP/PduV family microcompartment system protein, partial [Veillonella seminalis]
MAKADPNEIPVVTVAEADILGFLISAKEKEQMFPPGFASLFNKPAIG